MSLIHADLIEVRAGTDAIQMHCSTRQSAPCVLVQDLEHHEQASEMEPTSAGTNAADNIGNSRADEERDKAVRSVAEAAGRRTLRARPVAPKVQNEYARPYKTTAAARRERGQISSAYEVEAEESK